MHVRESHAAKKPGRVDWHCQTPWSAWLEMLTGLAGSLPPERTNKLRAYKSPSHAYPKHPVNECGQGEPIHAGALRIPPPVFICENKNILIKIRVADILSSIPFVPESFGMSAKSGQQIKKSIDQLSDPPKSQPLDLTR
jgi:hypothetical protein